MKNKRIPVFECGCAYCDKHKPLYAVGKHGEQTHMCLDCLNKKFKVKNEHL